MLLHKYKTWQDRLFDVFNVLFMIVVIFATLYPFWWSFIGSLNEGTNLARGAIFLWPRIFTLENYETVFQNRAIINAFGVTVARTIIGTLFSVLVTSMFAYAFSRKELVGKKIYGIIGLGTMLFHGGMIPTYINIQQLGLLDNFLVFILPGLMNFFNVLIIMAYFREISDSVVESARIDGASEYTIFFRIMLPLAKPVLAAITLFTGVGHWNSFFDAMLYITTETLYPLQVVLMQIIRDQSAALEMARRMGVSLEILERTVTATSVQLATMMVATIPIILLYPFLQKYFVKGMMIGAVKE